MPLNVSAVAIYICLSVADPEFDLVGESRTLSTGRGVEKVIESVYG